MKYLVIDFDSTFVKVESLDELARIALRGDPRKDEVFEAIRAITNQGMEGAITFTESLTRRLKLFSATRAHVQELVEYLRGQVSDSVVRNRIFFRANADRIYIISGGFMEYIVPIVREFGIRTDHVLANTLQFDETGSITGMDPANTLAGPHGKVRAVEQLDLTGEVYVIGDGFTDYEIRAEGRADVFIAFTENVSREPVVVKADYRAESFDKVLALLPADF